jgi:hypothetical protein
MSGEEKEDLPKIGKSPPSELSTKRKRQPRAAASSCAATVPRTAEYHACIVDQCGAKFRLAHQLKKHHRLDHIDLYCPVCRRVCANLEDFSCHLCSKMYR